MNVSVIVPSRTVYICFWKYDQGAAYLHMIWPAIIGCISEGCFCEKHKTVKCLVVPIVFQTLIFKYWFFTDYFLFSIGL